MWDFYQVPRRPPTRFLLSPARKALCRTDVYDTHECFVPQLRIDLHNHLVKRLILLAQNLSHPSVEARQRCNRNISNRH